MDIKTKKIVLIASVILFGLVVISFFYTIKNNSAFETRTGSLFYKIGVVNEGNTEVFKWDIGITKNNAKSGIIENESNEKFLVNFRNTVNGLTQKRFEVFLDIAYLIFIIVIYVSVQKDSKISKNKSNKKSFNIIMLLLIIFFVYKIGLSFVELSRLHKEVNFYFKIISYMRVI
ncbi:hypothetical protein JK636_14735 [Clostridium sp. YIM B02515]|uniref:Uncharacterized protein n=1 Tax=Clostridium rhizosphaerae TaxID=2803861 RepID=A0ABS1TCC0_9CLOT|nr:hypothetical protein [Clostridium rhizosphaerae]MBL4937008.1 hypothetical protein [Clostridium rhizosphaerae]